MTSYNRDHSGDDFNKVAEEGPTTQRKVREQKVRDSKGRYVKKGSANNKADSLTMYLFKSLRNLFDNHFFVTSIRFVFNYILDRLIGTGLEKDQTPWYMRTQSFLTLVGRFLNWSIAFTIIVTVFRYLYDSIMGLISYIPLGKSGRAGGAADRLGFFKELWPMNSQASFWEKITSFQPPWTTNPPPPLIHPLLTWPISFLSKVLLVVVGSFLFYTFIRVTARMIIILLHKIFDWVTPANLQTLQDVVERHSTQTLQHIRNLGNYVILIDKTLEEVRKQAGLAREVQEGLRDISRDAVEIRELERRFTALVAKISSQLDTLGDQSEDMSYTLASTMKIIVSEYEKSHNAMEKGLIDDESFARSYRIMREGKGQGFGIPYLQSVRKILDPNAEITMEVGRISRIIESENENSKEAERRAASSPRSESEDDDRQAGSNPRGGLSRPLNLNDNRNKASGDPSSSGNPPSGASSGGA